MLWPSPPDACCAAGIVQKDLIIVVCADHYVYVIDIQHTNWHVIRRIETTLNVMACTCALRLLSLQWHVCAGRHYLRTMYMQPDIKMISN